MNWAIDTVRFWRRFHIFVKIFIPFFFVVLIKWLLRYIFIQSRTYLCSYIRKCNFNINKANITSSILLEFAILDQRYWIYENEKNLNFKYSVRHIGLWTNDFELIRGDLIYSVRYIRFSILNLGEIRNFRCLIYPMIPEISANLLFKKLT